MQPTQSCFSLQIGAKVQIAMTAALSTRLGLLQGLIISSPTSVQKGNRQDRAEPPDSAKHRSHDGPPSARLIHLVSVSSCELKRRCAIGVHQNLSIPFHHLRSKLAGSVQVRLEHWRGASLPAIEILGFGQLH